MAALNRNGRPAIEDEEAQAMERIARSHDGRVYMHRLQRIIDKHRDTELELDGAQSDRMKGRIQELKDLEREFSDAAGLEKSLKSDPQARFG